MAKCMMCRRREAVYYRVESGDLVCMKCLEIGIMKRVKKAINSHAMLTPFDNVGFVVEPWDIETSMAAARIFCEIEKRYPSRVIAFIPRGVNGGWVGADETLYYSVGFEEVKGYKEARRRLLETVLPHAKRAKLQKLVLPHPLETTTLMFIDAIYRLDFEELASLTPRYDGGTVYILNPYYKVPRAELRLYYHLHCGPRAKPRTRWKKDRLCEYSKATLRLLKEHVELLHSTSYSSEVISGRLVKRMKPCRVCTLPSYGGLCTVHSRT